MRSPRSSLMSPAPRPVFYEAPLSTKREANPARIQSVPRIARTAPARSRMVHHRFEMQRPHMVSFKNMSQNVAMLSPVYNPRSEGSYFDQVFEVVKVLGEGSFGEVVSVRSREDRRMYAVKRVLEPFRSESDRTTKLREVQKHELIPPHSNLVSFMQAWEEQGRLYIQTELCEQSLAEYTQLVHSVPEAEVWNFFIDILNAVHHLHNHGLLHLDIKPENILLTKDKICKLGDFGRVFDMNVDSKENAEEGDSKYLAGEVLNNLPTPAADVFSLGMTVLEIATDMDLPSDGSRWHDIREGRIPPRFFEHISSDLHDVIMLMLTKDPQTRPTTKQLLSLASVQRISEGRRVTVGVQEMKNMFTDRLLYLYIFVLAILAMAKEALSQLFSWKRPRTVIPHTPVSTRAVIPRQEEEWHVSDDEDHHRNMMSFHSREEDSRSVTRFRENPYPRYRLNFDDDTTSDSNTPEETAVSSIASDNSEDNGRSVTPDDPLPAKDSGDWDSRFSDSDSDEPFVRRGPKTCPPAMYARSQYRARIHKRPPPILNLHLLDTPEGLDSAPVRETTPPVTVAPPAPEERRRRTRSDFKKRLISDMNSSADEC